MRLFTTKEVICLFFVLAMPVPLAAITAVPSEAAVKSKKPTKPPSMVPIDTVGKSNERAFDPTDLKATLEGRLSLTWCSLSVGPSKYCEVHFELMPDGRYADLRIWRSSGDPSFDTIAKSCVDQTQFLAYEGPDHITCIATFRTEP